MLTDPELTAIYKRANNIGEGKNPPISTKFIFAAMRLIREEALTKAAEECENMNQGWASDDQLRCAEMIRRLK